MRRFSVSVLWNQISLQQPRSCSSTGGTAPPTASGGEVPSSSSISGPSGVTLPEAEGEEANGAVPIKKKRAERIVNNCPYKRPALPRKDNEMETQLDLRDRIFETDTILDILKDRQRKLSTLKEKNYYSPNLNQIDDLLKGMEDLDGYSEKERAVVRSDWSIIGVDETGVGAWAGPIVLSAATVPLTINTLYATAFEEDLAKEFMAAHAKLEADIESAVAALEGEGNTDSLDSSALRTNAKEMILSGKLVGADFANSAPEVTIDRPRILSSAAAIALGILPPPQKSQNYDELCLQVPFGSALLTPPAAVTDRVEGEKQRKKQPESRKEVSPVIFAPRPVAIRDSKAMSYSAVTATSGALDRYIARGDIDTVTKLLDATTLQKGIRVPQDNAQVEVCAALEQKMIDRLWKMIQENQQNLTAESATLTAETTTVGEGAAHPEMNPLLLDSHGGGALKYVLPPAGTLFDEDFERQKIRELVLLPKLMVILDGGDLSSKLFDAYCPANLQSYSRIARSKFAKDRAPAATGPQVLLSNVRAIPKGDSLSFSVAVASITAKHRQIQEAQKLHELYPNYGFDSHHGYGTEQHAEAIKIFGSIPGVHRSVQYSDQMIAAQQAHDEAATRPGKHMDVKMEDAPKPVSVTGLASVIPPHVVEVVEEAVDREGSMDLAEGSTATTPAAGSQPDEPEKGPNTDELTSEVSHPHAAAAPTERAPLGEEDAPQEVEPSVAEEEEETQAAIAEEDAPQEASPAEEEETQGATASTAIVEQDQNERAILAKDKTGRGVKKVSLVKTSRRVTEANATNRKPPVIKKEKTVKKIVPKKKAVPKKKIVPKKKAVPKKKNIVPKKKVVKVMSKKKTTVSLRKKVENLEKKIRVRSPSNGSLPISSVTHREMMAVLRHLR